nr:MAG TPA: hypothetical protein [Caudoviricetes sp.]
MSKKTLFKTKLMHLILRLIVSQNFLLLKKLVML